MKVKFDYISFAKIAGYTTLKKSLTRRTGKAEIESKIRISDSEKRAGKLLDALLTKPDKGSLKNDAISEFYSDLASPSYQKTNLAINQNTADRHGRT